MKLDFRHLKLHPREREEFYLQGQVSADLLTDFGGKVLAPVKVDIVVENTGSLFVGRGRVKTLVQLICSRCLQEFKYSLDIDLDLIMAEANQEIALSADDEVITFTGDEVEINAGIEEAIYMAIPFIPLCHPDCRGLCSGCGQDKNISVCQCREDTIDPRWEKLKTLQ